MSVQGNIPPITIRDFIGINQEGGNLLAGESPDCENVIGRPGGGCSTWKGRDEFDDPKVGHIQGLHSCVWPEDGHKSIILRSPTKLLVREAGRFTDIGRDLDFDISPRNPTSFAQVFDGRFLIGATHLGDQPFVWDGHRDRPAQPLDVAGNYKVVGEWTGRLFGIGDLNNPMTAQYGKPDQLEIREGGTLTFPDHPRATKLVGWRAYTGAYALWWGDHGLWLSEWLGSYPHFERTKIIEYDCTCASNAAIVRIPGQGFAWLGSDETAWAIIGLNVFRIDTSGDKRGARRIWRILKSASKRDLELSAGFWHPGRNMPIWSFPTEICTDQSPWSNSRSFGWDPKTTALWPISHAFNATCRTAYLEHEELIGSDGDGHLWLVDYNASTDKGSEPVPWHIALDWAGDQNALLKFLEIRIKRDMAGADKVGVECWNEYNKTPIKKFFSVKQSYKGVASRLATNLDVAAGRAQAVGETIPASGWVRATAADVEADRAEEVGELIPSYDPGGPNDLGAPPEAIIACSKKVNLKGHFMKTRFSNEYQVNGEVRHYSGPVRPMQEVSMTIRRLK